MRLLQPVHSLRRLVRAGHHQDLAVGHESNVAIVFHQLYRTIILVLEAVLTHTQVRSFAYVAPVEMHSFPANEHVAPGEICVATFSILCPGIQGSDVVAPYSKKDLFPEIYANFALRDHLLGTSQPPYLLIPRVDIEALADGSTLLQGAHIQLSGDHPAKYTHYDLGR